MEPVDIEILDASEILSETLKETLKTMYSKHLLRTIGESKVFA